MATRDVSRDGWRNRIETYVLTHFGPIWRLIQRSAWLRRRVNRTLINLAVRKTKPRPHQFSTIGSYTSWDSLTDRTFSGRHLPAADDAYVASLPPVEEVVNLFRRPAAGERQSIKSTLLFSHFAQWFTDGFLRTDRTFPLKNTSNHDIDLSPLYGTRAAHTALLRAKTGGRLKSQVIRGEEYPPYYYDNNGNPSPEFLRLPIFAPESLPIERKRRLFAMGVERANNQVGFVMLNTLFLREHNRICAVLSHEYPNWDSDRLFQTARNVVVVLLIKIVVEEYINHIAPYHFKFRADASSFWSEPWYRMNWMTVEFNLLYRWHSLVADHVLYDGQRLSLEQTFFNNDLLTSRGLASWFDDASRQPSGEVSLFNTSTIEIMLDTERRSIELSRAAKVRSYNDYRAAFRYPRVTEFNQITGREEVQAALQRAYKNVDQVEFYVGLFAEDVRPGSALPALVGRMVGVDAFSQAFTNPLLSIHVFNAQTFSKKGLEIIESTRTLGDIVRRNVKVAPLDLRVSFTRSDFRQ
jgi:prostaglandin-endoperoxide synthase 2